MGSPTDRPRAGERQLSLCGPSAGRSPSHLSVQPRSGAAWQALPPCRSCTGKGQQRPAAALLHAEAMNVGRFFVVSLVRPQKLGILLSRREQVDRAGGASVPVPPALPWPLTCVCACPQPEAGTAGAASPGPSPRSGARRDPPRPPNRASAPGPAARLIIGY